MTHRSIVSKVAVVVVLTAVAGAPGTARAQETAIHTETRVQPFRPSSLDGAVTCRRSESERKAAAALPAVFAGIVIDWLFTQGAGYFARHLEKKIKSYTHGYSTEPRYLDAFNPGYWNGDQSCVEMQRVHCIVAKTKTDEGTATCEGVEVLVGLSIVIKLKREQGNRMLRVLPHTVQMWQLGEEHPRHDGGAVTVTARFHVESVGWTADGAGRPWSSPAVPVAALECQIAKGRREAEDSEKSCRREYFTADEEADPALWKQAHVLPLPPPTEQALMFSVAEVGQPGRGLEQFQKFFDAKGGDMSQALSDAFKKKLGIGQ